MKRKSWGIFLTVTMFVAMVSFGAWAQESGGTDQSTDSPEADREVVQPLPDPMQAATQASQDALNQGTPTREEMFVYSVSPWMGMEFGGTFAPRQVDTLYLMAGAPSIINAQRTEVYYWPITGEYMANWFELREEVPGKLQISQDGQVIETLERIDYAYYYPSGYSGTQLLYLGDEAVEVYEDYQSRMDAYYDALSRYYQDQREWQQQIDVILKEVRETGQPKDPSEIPEPPVQPQAPTDFAYQPRQAFAVDLPPGRYQLSVIDNDGNVVPDSVRTLEVFTSRRTGVGFGVIPEHKWTRRFPSNDASDVFYLDGTRVFYLLPYNAKEFNAYKYTKMTNLHKPLEGEGTRSAWAWVQFEPIDESARLQILKDGQVIQEVFREPFYVRQTPGYALGYEIVRLDENDPFMAGRTPTFEGYRVVMQGDGEYEIRFVDEQGNVLDGSSRAVRAVHRPGGWLYGISVIPLGVGLVVFGWRRTKRRRHSEIEA